VAAEGTTRGRLAGSCAPHQVLTDSREGEALRELRRRREVRSGVRMSQS